MKYLVNYADITYKPAQAYCTNKAYKKGKFDMVFEYGPEDITKDFLERNKEWFVAGDTQTGKYGLWRPYIVMDALNRINEGDYLCYCDSGAYFVNDVNRLIEVMERDTLEVLVFELPLKEFQWTKNDIFRYLVAEKPEITQSNQRMSTCFLIKKCGRAMDIFKEYYEISLKAPWLFTDEDNRLGGSNDKAFIQNRHNQSVLSVLTKKYGIAAYRDPSDYGKKAKLYSFTDGVIFEEKKYPTSSYPVMIISHRNGRVTFKTHIMTWTRMLLTPRQYLTVLRFFQNIGKE